MSSITKAVRLLFSSGGSAPVAKGILKTEHHHGGSIEHAESKGSSSKGRFLTPGFDPSAPRSFGVKSGTRLDDLNDIDPAKVEKLPAEMATENKKVRESIYSRISQSFSKFISYFAFPKMSFPKSMATQKEEAIANVLDGTGTKEDLAALLKKENPMGTSNWASQRADGLIREAYGKRAFERLDEIQSGGVSQDLKDQLKSDLMNAMPRVAVDDAEDVQKKNDLALLTTEFLLDQKEHPKHKADLKKEILQDKWPTEILNDPGVVAKIEKLKTPAISVDGKSVWRDVDSETASETDSNIDSNTISPDPHKVPLMKTPMGAWEVY